MNEPANPIFVGLDIGTSTVRCVVGMRDSRDQSALSVIGHGLAPNQGLRKGVVVHIDDTAEAIVQAVTEAERISGVQIHNATVNINGSHVTGLNSRGVIAISSPDHGITAEDRDRVEEAATIVKLPPNREIVQAFAKSYRLDGQDNLKDPVGMHGVRLEVDCHMVTVATPNLRNLNMALDKAQINPRHHTVSSLAAAEAVLTRQQKEAGTCVLDMGAGTTNLAIIEDGEIQHVAVIPMGGTHITNDLAIGLKTDLDIAEAVKLKHAKLGEESDKPLHITVDGKYHTFSGAEVNMIVEARVEELLEYVEKELVKIHRSRKLPGGVVLIGGTAGLPGLAEYVKDKLQLPARIGKVQGLAGLVDTVDTPAFATAAGLMMLDVLLGSFSDQAVPAQAFGSNIGTTLSSLLSRLKSK